jgi:hypothetical protein
MPLKPSTVVDDESCEFGDERGRAGFRQETLGEFEAGPRAGANASGRAYASLSESRCFGATVASIDASTAPRASQMATSMSLVKATPTRAFVLAQVLAADGATVTAYVR